MQPADDNLVAVVNQLRRGDDAARPEVRARLEAALVPMVRVALRTGRGVPAVVGWVRREATGATPSEADWRAGPLARRMCSVVLDRLRPIALHARETVCV
jgi:hypothetical protein